MAIRLAGAACAGLLALVSTTATAQSAPALSQAATVWQLRSGLNVAALACRGAGEAAIVAGYNRLLADHRAELASVYRTVAREYGSESAFDAAMTRTYNTYAQPAAQAALCANAEDVLAAIGDRPLGEVADTALARLQGNAQPGYGQVMTQVAVATIPHILDERQDDRRAEEEEAIEADYAPGDE